jgi:hypothetical protein
VSPTLARLLTRLYPQAWRERYGAEFEHFLLKSSGSPWGAGANVIWSACKEHVFPTRGKTMEQQFRSVLKNPSAFLPVAMSLTALTIVCVDIALHRGVVVREADEGTTAHLWQILMAGQLPVLAFFAIRWLPRAPRPALCVLALQAGAALASMAPVFFLNL